MTLLFHSKNMSSILIVGSLLLRAVVQLVVYLLWVQKIAGSNPANPKVFNSMLKSRYKVLFSLPPEILHYHDLKFNRLFLFGLEGWLLQHKKRRVPFLYNSTLLLMNTLISSSSILRNLVYGLIKTYYKYIKLRGRGFKYLLVQSTLSIKFGFSHKLYYTIPNNICITLLTKQVLKVTCKSSHLLNSVFFDLHSIRKLNKYKGKGLIYYKDYLMLKASSKKTKV
jgi:hypothetical protein